MFFNEIHSLRAKFTLGRMDLFAFEKAPNEFNDFLSGLFSDVDAPKIQLLFHDGKEWFSRGIVITIAPLRDILDRIPCFVGSFRYCLLRYRPHWFEWQINAFGISFSIRAFHSALNNNIMVFLISKACPTTFLLHSSFTMATYNFPSEVFTSVISVDSAQFGLPTLNRFLIRLCATSFSGCIPAGFQYFGTHQGLTPSCLMVIKTAFWPTCIPSLCRLL